MVYTKAVVRTHFSNGKFLSPLPNEKCHWHFPSEKCVRIIIQISNRNQAVQYNNTLWHILSVIVWYGDRLTGLYLAGNHVFDIYENMPVFFNKIFRGHFSMKNATAIFGFENVCILS